MIDTLLELLRDGWGRLRAAIDPSRRLCRQPARVAANPRRR
ncbi:MAG: hypothetical protein QJR03_08295 [Sphaerobacter sp.]|nr:hypothetical protein [Sphaerobacter sp.]